MLRDKNWQCPYCQHAASRRWNVVDHIRGVHRVDGNPIDKRQSGKGRKTSFANLDGTHIDRRSAPSPYNFKRSSMNYSNQASNDKGDIIDEMHQFLTDMDKRRRKLEEIIEIVRKYQPLPIQIAYTDISNTTIKDKEKIEPPSILRQDKPQSHEVPVQTHNYKIGITSENTKTEKASQDLSSGQKRETKWWAIRTEYLVSDSEGDRWDVNAPPKKTWVRKLSICGRIIDMYKVSDSDPFEELREDAKRWEKSFILYQ